MTKRKKDKTLAGPGGRAAERLRMFLDARQPEIEQPTKKDSPATQSTQESRKAKSGNARKT